jgi:hypothetical protein
VKSFHILTSRLTPGDEYVWQWRYRNGETGFEDFRFPVEAVSVIQKVQQWNFSERKSREITSLFDDNSIQMIDKRISFSDGVVSVVMAPR